MLVPLAGSYSPMLVPVLEGPLGPLTGRAGREPACWLRPAYRKGFLSPGYRDGREESRYRTVLGSGMSSAAQQSWAGHPFHVAGPVGPARDLDQD